jgi:hypothetical protein
MEEYKFQSPEHNGLKKDELSKYFRICTEKPCGFYRSANSRFQWVGQVAMMETNKSIQNFGWQTSQKMSLETPKRRWEDTIRMGGRLKWLKYHGTGSSLTADRHSKSSLPRCENNFQYPFDF